MEAVMMVQVAAWAVVAVLGSFVTVAVVSDPCYK